MALQSSPKVTITQQAVRNSGLVQLDNPAIGLYTADTLLAATIICFKI